MKLTPERLGRAAYWQRVPGTHTVRPPGTCSENELSERCSRCGDCASICPQGLIEFDLNGFPVLSNSAACEQCGLCADVCSPRAVGFTDMTAEGLAFELRLETSASFSSNIRKVAGNA